MYNILHLAWMNGFGNSTKSCQLKSIETLFLLVASKRIVSIAKVKNLRPRTPGLWDLGLWDPATWDPGTQDPGTWSLGLGNCNRETQNPESKTLRIELVTQIPSIPTRTTDWINFNCEASFDNKKLGYVSQKLRCSSRLTKNFAKIFWHLT